MVRLVEFDRVMEERVRFVEETPRALIIDRTLDRLQRGEDPVDLVTAAVLAVSRSSELPTDHHGGPVHPVSGVHAIVGMLARLEGDAALLPALQSVALANKHIHLPSMGPSVMVAFDDLNRKLDKAEVLKRLEQAMAERQARLAERWLTLACEQATPGEILNSLLTVAIRRNSLDDHYFLFPTYACRALDAIGWQWAPVLLRPVVRYLSRHHSFDAFGEFNPKTIAEGIEFYKRFHVLETLMEKHGLTEERVAQRTSEAEFATLEALATEIGEVDEIGSLPETIARAMGAGLSLEGTVEAISIGGARLFLRSHTNNPFDVHIHTGAAARRYLLGFEEVSFRHKVLSLLGWAWGYEVRYLDHTLNWTWQREAHELRDAPQAQMLAEIEQRILAIDGYDVTNLPVAINNLVAPDEIRDIVALAQSYVQAGYDTERLFALTASLVCREDASEMHGYKLQQAAYEEYLVCREPLRWVHAVAAVKQAAVNAPTKPHQVYPQYAARSAAA